MHQVKLDAELRVKQGKEQCKKIRAEGKVPAIIYGKEFENVMIKIQAKELQKTLSTSAGTMVIIDLNVKDGQNEKQYTTMVAEIQKDVFQKVYHHIDFHKISLDELVHADIPIALRGDAKGVKTGGILDQLMWKIPLKALPLDLPERITLDVSGLDENDSLSVNDLNLGENVQCLLDSDEMIVIVHPPRVMEEAAAGEEKAAEPAAV